MTEGDFGCDSKKVLKEKFDRTHLGRAPIVLHFPHYLTRLCQKTEDETRGSKEEGSHRGMVGRGHKRGEIYVGKQLKTSS